MKTKWPELSNRTISAALGGDPRAFRRLYTFYKDRVRATVAARIRHFPAMKVNIDDVIGEVWTHLTAHDLRLLRCYEPSRGPFGYFICMLAANHAWDQIRKHLRRPAEAHLDEQSLDMAQSSDFRQWWCHDMLARLLTAARQTVLKKDIDLHIFIAVEVKGMLVKEVAQDLGMSHDAVYQRHHRLKKRLQRLAIEVFGTDRPDSENSTQWLEAMVALAWVILMTTNNQGQASLTDLLN